MSKFNFFERREIITTNFTDHLFDFGGWISMGVIIANEATLADKIVEYSFDGTNSHGEVNTNIGFSFDSRKESKIWFRLKEEGNAIIVRVEAWA